MLLTMKMYSQKYDLKETYPNTQMDYIHMILILNKSIRY